MMANSYEYVLSVQFIYLVEVSWMHNRKDRDKICVYSRERKKHTHTQFCSRYKIVQVCEFTSHVLQREMIDLALHYFCCWVEPYCTY